MRKVSALLGNSQRLDGGAMFGNAPRALWTRWVKPDSENRIPLACRAMLVREGGRNLLFETGVGAFFDPAMRARFGVVEEEHVLLKSLASVGLTHEQIDCVVLSHLHFDHAGGLLTAYSEDQSPQLLFPNATYVVSEQAWERAQHPHPRDRASFIPALNALLSESGRLHVVSDLSDPILGEGYRFHLSQGHTPGLLLTEVTMPGGPLLFAGDLIPGLPWVHVPITMGYDRFAEQVINEKKALLSALLQRDGRLFFTHDFEVAVATLSKNDRGRFCVHTPLAHPVDLAR